jgi:hypothetical protein
VTGFCQGSSQALSTTHPRRLQTMCAGSGCRDRLGELRGGQGIDAMAAQSCEVPEVVRHHHRTAGRTRNLGDVRVVDPPTDEMIVSCGAGPASETAN